MKILFALGMVAVLGLSACAPSPTPTLTLLENCIFIALLFHEMVYTVLFWWRLL